MNGISWRPCSMKGNILGKRLIVFGLAVVYCCSPLFAQEELKLIPPRAIGVVRVASIDTLAKDTVALVYSRLRSCAKACMISPTQPLIRSSNCSGRRATCTCPRTDFAGPAC